MKAGCSSRTDRPPLVPRVVGGGLGAHPPQVVAAWEVYLLHPRCNFGREGALACLYPPNLQSSPPQCAWPYLGPKQSKASQGLASNVFWGKTEGITHPTQPDKTPPLADSMHSNLTANADVAVYFPQHGQHGAAVPGSTAVRLAWCAHPTQYMPVPTTHPPSPAPCPSCHYINLNRCQGT